MDTFAYAEPFKVSINHDDQRSLPARAHVRDLATRNGSDCDTGHWQSRSVHLPVAPIVTTRRIVSPLSVVTT